MIERRRRRTALSTKLTSNCYVTTCKPRDAAAAATAAAAAVVVLVLHAVASVTTRNRLDIRTRRSPSNTSDKFHGDTARCWRSDGRSERRRCRRAGGCRHRPSAVLRRQRQRGGGRPSSWVAQSLVGHVYMRRSGRSQAWPPHTAPQSSA